MEGTTSKGQVKAQLKKACDLYINLTNYLLDIAYESLLENYDTANYSRCIESVMKVINIAESVNASSQLPSSYSAQQQLASSSRNVPVNSMTAAPRTPLRTTSQIHQEKLHSRELHKIHLDKVLGSIDPLKMKNFIKTYQTEKFNKMSSRKGRNIPEYELEDSSTYATQNTTANVESLNLILD
jgi:hypothetical protein